MAEIVTLKHREQVDVLIRRLQAAKADSLRTGGEYLAHVNDEKGQPLLAIQVHLAGEPSRRRSAR